MIEPKLRFKADDGSQFPDWDEKVFGDFVDTHIEKTSDKDKYPLYSLTIESGVQPKTDRYEREFLVKKEGDNYKIVPPNAFVYNPMNLRFGALKVNHEKFSVSVSGYYDVFSLKDNSVLAFWENYLVTPKMLNYYFSIATGSLIEKLRVHYSQFVKIKKLLPSLPEQQKIAEFLSTIDTVIEKQKETVSAWEERKKGVMQKLFSQEVRFKADDGNEFSEWEEKKLGDISERVLVGLATTVTPYYRKKGRPMFRNLNIKQGYLDDRDMLFLDEDYADSQKNKAIHFGDILTVHTGNIGWSCLIPEKYEGALSFTTLITTVKSNVVSNKYVCAFLNSPLGMNRMQNLAFSGGRANLNTSEFQKVQVPVPCLAEQQKIADCLLSLDEVIEKQKSTLAAWEELKKGLLQQMFV
mgnify:CR=1 FL=1